MQIGTNTDNKFDVIIVGAGPAGAGCARELARKNHRVLLVEKMMEIGEPNYSTAGTAPETIKEFDIPKNLIYTSWNAIQTSGPNGKYTTVKYDKIIGYSLKFRELKQFLVKDAIEHGAVTLAETTAKELIYEDNKIIGIKTSGIQGDEQYFASVIIDASGAEGIFATKLGLRKNKDIFLGVGIEQIVAGVKCPDRGNTVYIGFGSKVAPAGYAWMFPMSSSEAKVGIAWMPKDHNNKLDIKSYFYDFLKTYPGLEKAEPIENHAHACPMTYGGKMLERYSLDNFICLGDAGAQVNPLFGEGIRHLLWSGRMAAGVISQAIKTKDFTQKNLSQYDKMWKDYAQKKWQLSTFLHNILYSSNDEIIENFVSIVPKLRKQTILDIIWYYKKEAIGEVIKNMASSKIADIKNIFNKIG